jgi:hypothetical protein
LARNSIGVRSSGNFTSIRAFQTSKMSEDKQSEERKSLKKTKSGLADKVYFNTNAVKK